MCIVVLCTPWHLDSCMQEPQRSFFIVLYISDRFIKRISCAQEGWILCFCILAEKTLMWSGTWPEDCYRSPECWPMSILCDSDPLTYTNSGLSPVASVTMTQVWNTACPATTGGGGGAFRPDCQPASAHQWPRGDFSCLLFLAFLTTDHLPGGCVLNCQK